MNHTALARATALFFAAALLPAQRPTVVAAAPATDLLIARLTDDDPAAAAAATAALVRGGPAVVPALRRALRERDDPAFVARAERVLAICSVDVPVVHGLKVGLAVDQTTAAPGAGTVLTSTVCNVTDRDIVLYVGMSYSGNVFESGAAVRQLVGEPGGPATEVAATYRVGFCGTGAFPLVVTIPAHDFLRFQSTVVYTEGQAASGVLQVGPFCQLPVDDGSVRLRVAHEVRADLAPSWRKTDPKPNWAGSLRSNEVLLRLGAGAAGACQPAASAKIR